MPMSTFVEIPAEKSTQMLDALRRARYGLPASAPYLAGVCIGLQPHGERSGPVLPRLDRSRVVRAYRRGRWPWGGLRSTRWSGAALALT